MSTTIKQKTEYKNKEVRQILRIFYNLPRTDKIHLNDLVIRTDTNIDNGILYDSRFEIDKEGYIKEYRLLTSKKRYVGIRVVDNCWICTTKPHTRSDVLLIDSIIREREKPAHKPINTNDHQLELTIEVD